MVNVVSYYTKDIAEFIYTQMMQNFHSEPPKFEQVSVNPFVKIELNTILQNIKLILFMT